MKHNYLEGKLKARLADDPAVFDFLQGQVLDGLRYRVLADPADEWVSDRFWQALGYSAHNQPTDAGAYYMALEPADRARAQQAEEDMLSNPAQPSSQILRFRHLDGSAVWMCCQSVLLHDDHGVPTHLFSTLRNVTPEKQEMAYAQEVANHYSLILGNQSVYIIRTDVQGNYTYVNELFYERFGQDSAILGTSSLLSIVEEDRPKCLDVVMLCLTEPEVPHQVILRKPYQGNVVKSNHWEFKGIRGPEGDVVEILCVGYDITLLVENLEKLQHLLDVTSQQNIRLQNFAYIISHNIRSHSANLTSLAHLLAEAEDEEQRGMFLQMLHTSTEKLADTIVNLSDIVAVNSNVNKPKEPRRLKEEIDKTLEALSVVIHQHHIGVDVQVPADVAVTVVPAYLDSILLNLISNAVKYRSPERKALIRLETHREPGFVVLSVHDNGLGINMARNRAKLFGMYKTFHDNEDARGVGLFITKNQIEAMQGHIVVESEVGVGSTFKVYFNENA